jgi:ATP-dependent protease ClpP protease subunit
VSALAELADVPVLVRVNCKGGDVQDGTAIYNAFNNHNAEVTFRIEGWACSMGTVIPCSGRVEAYPSAMLMIHDSSTVLYGNAKTLRDTANMLEKVDQQMADIYAKKSGTPAADWQTRMDGEVDGSWLTAAEAKELGLVDEIIDGEAKATALLDRNGAKALSAEEGAMLLPVATMTENLPQPVIAAMRPTMTASLPPSLRTILGENPLTGLVRMTGEFVAVNEVAEPTDPTEPTEPTEPPPPEAVDPVVAERKRAAAIRAAAKAAGLDSLADELIEQGTSAEAAGKIILSAKAAVPDDVNPRHGADLDDPQKQIDAKWAAVYDTSGFKK